MASSVRIEVERAAKIISDAGGLVVGRTKLQKIAYLLEAMGLGEGFDFEYKHYGPYSETLSTALRYGDMLGTIHEEVKTASWGGYYSIFTCNCQSSTPPESARRKVVELGNSADPVELELAATAVLLSSEGYQDPWKETEQRKPDKAADGRVGKAKALLARFKELDEQKSIPENI
ncbi:hypothetical protein [Sphingobium sp. DC-2]|uniref:hypothetical protein n=1 Tax=Sphingobium sp. DC-2 TaxID=1303256 RepID=UPI0012DC26F7|nr:hypothetical protein [Sphingobium sp. DC-2]